MIELVRVAEDAQKLCETKGWGFCIIGGLALQVWGESRITMDVDITLLTGFGEEEEFIEPLLEKFTARIPDARRFALRNRVLLIESENGIGIDVSLGAFDFEVEMIERSVYEEFLPDVKLRICTAEDLIIMKSFAARPKDWLDVESILIRQTGLDWDHIFRQLRPLAELKEMPEIEDRLLRLKQQFYEE